METTNNFWFDFVTYFFGTHNLALVVVCFLYGCIGMVIMMLVDLMARNEASKRTPPKFQVAFFVRDNGTRIVLNFFMMLVCIRFYSDFYGSPTTPKIACIIGFLADVLALIAKKRKQKLKEDSIAGDKLVITEETVNTASTTVETTKQGYENKDN